MDMVEIIARSQNGRGLQALGAKFGLTDSQTRSAVEQLAPAVMAGLRRELQSGPEGVSGVVKALATGNHGKYLDRDHDGVADDGNAMLGHIFKSKEVSRGVAEKASTASGISPAILKRMLPVVTAMVMGGLSRQITSGQAQAQSASAKHAPFQQTAPGAAPGKVATATRPGPAAAAPAKVAAGGQPSQNAAAPSAAGSTGLGGILGQVLGGGGGIGDLLGQLVGGSSGATRSATGGGGIGDILGQLTGGSAAASGGGIGSILGGLFGADARPDVRQQATQSIGGFLSSLLGGGTGEAANADHLLAEVDRTRTSR